MLAAAEEVFGEFGKAGSTEEVARRAGVGIGTVFRHFPTKQLLIEATIVRHLTLLTDTARARGEDSEAGAAFRTTFREMVSGAPAKLALLALLEESAAPAGAPMRWKLVPLRCGTPSRCCCPGARKPARCARTQRWTRSTC
ncbi:helix-turn-helix domain-containing protein [Streptomyces sp. M19]